MITLDLLGHGHSDRPRDMWRYSMALYGHQVVALIDHLGIEEAVVMGTSLGANAALEVASSHPERLRGMVIEMPVLDNGLLGSALAFTPLLVALTFGEPVMKLIARATRAIPRRLAAALRQRDARPRGARNRARAARCSRACSSDVWHRHAMSGERSPLRRSCSATDATRSTPSRTPACSRRRCRTRACLEADSLVELRARPERLTGEIAGFLDEVWRARRGTRSARGSGRTARSGRAR